MTYADTNHAELRPMREWIQVNRARPADYRRDRATIEAAIRYAGARPGAPKKKQKATP